MNTDSYSQPHTQPNSSSPSSQNSHSNESPGSITMKKRDCFELLSAYLDGEVNANERRQVEEWLSHDQAIRELYRQQLEIRQGLRNMPIPVSQHSGETIVQRVFTSVNRRYQLKWMLGGAAIAACVCGTITGLLPIPRTWELANNNLIETTPTTKATLSKLNTSPPMVALNNPVIEIPKTAVAPTQAVGNDLN